MGFTTLPPTLASLDTNTLQTRACLDLAPCLPQALAPALVLVQSQLMTFLPPSQEKVSVFYGRVPEEGGGGEEGRSVSLAYFQTVMTNTW